MDYRIRWLNRFTASWMAYFWLADAEPVFRRPAAGPLEGMEDTATKRHNLPDTRYLCPTPAGDRLGLKTLSHTWQHLNRTA